MAGARAYRVYLPPAYAKSRTTRYPVIYWFHGYEPENQARDAALAAYVAAHPVIVVDSGPADTTGQFPLYFPELVEHIDKTLRTIPDRDHRAVTGSGAGGFLAIWQAAKCPDLVASASSFGAIPRSPRRPPGLRRRFLPRRSLPHARPGPHPPGGRRFLPRRNPRLPPRRLRPSASQARRLQPRRPLPQLRRLGLGSGFRPPPPRLHRAGKRLPRPASAPRCASGSPPAPPSPSVKLSITSPRLYTPGAVYPVTYIRLRDGKVRRATQKADARGRLSFDIDGDACEIGIGAAAGIALSSFEIAGAAWAAAGQPIQARLKFWNKGAARSATTLLQMGKPHPRREVQDPVRPPEQSRARRIRDPARSPSPSTAPPSPAPASWLPMAISASPSTSPSTPPPPRSPTYQIADGLTVPPYPHPLGEGNRDGHAAPGESFAVLLPDAGALRAAELFTNDPCVDNTVRISEAGTRISLPTIRSACEPGHRIHVAGADRPQLFRPGNPRLVPQSLRGCETLKRTGSQPANILCCQVSSSVSWFAYAAGSRLCSISVPWSERPG